MVGGFGRMGVKFGGMGSAGGGVGDVIAPTLTSPFGLPLGDTNAFQGVTTNEGNGTLYFLLTTSATPPSAAQVKAGQDHTGAAATYAFGQAVSSTGIKSNTATGLTSNTAYYGYLMHEDAAANQSSVAASGILTTLTTGTSDTDFDNLVAAASVAPTNLRKGYVARFIQALYAASVWTKIDVMWVLAAHDEQFGRLNWKSPGNFTLTAVNSPTFTTDRGFAGNGSTSYLATGWDAATNGVQYTRNDCHVSAYNNTAGNNGIAFGTSSGFNIQVTVRDVSGAQATRGRANAGSDLLSGVTATMPEQAIMRRNVSTDQTILVTGVQTATGAQASTALGTSDLNIGMVGTVYSTARVAGAALGAYLDDTEALAYYTAWNAYMVAVGADT